jgi:hypothetical protein
MVGMVTSERTTTPWLTAAWVVLAAVVVVLMAHGLLGFGGSEHTPLFVDWLNDAAMWAVACLCLGGAWHAARNRDAWLLVGAGLAAWALGDTIWSFRGGDAPSTAVSVSDLLWIAWYPLVVAALVLLVRDRVPRFELHRWVDGIVVMLVVATPWVAVFLQPAADRSTASTVADVVDFFYPLGDFVIVGAVLGIFALMGWRVGRMWLTLGVGFAAMAIADAAYSVDALSRFHHHSGSTYDALWLAGAILVAYAAWLPAPGHLEPVEVFGWAAIALPLAAQLFAITLQVYGLFAYVPRSERVLTIVVLLIAVVQIIVSRPRRREPDEPSRR